MQAPLISDPAAQQANMAAIMWQMQMGAPNPMMGMGGMMPPWGAPPPAPALPSVLNVKVEGINFEYQLTEDDVRKVFSRYGGVKEVKVDREGTKATVTFEQPGQALAAQQDLDKKGLAGMSGAYLKVEFPAATPLDPSYAMAAAATQWPVAPMMPGGFPGYAPMAPPMPGPSSVGGGMAGMPSSPGGRPKKFTCKLEVGIENEGEFRVGSRAIQIAKQIWHDPKFQEHGGKSRVRGKGIGGPQEADEPLALCISCREQEPFDKAVQFAEAQLLKVHSDYKEFCKQRGLPVPDLSVKVSKKGSTFGGDDLLDAGGNVDVPKGERPEGAPTEEEIEDIIEKRNEARKAANYKKADEYRDMLKARGVVLMDDKHAKGNCAGKEVTKWRYWRP